MNKLIMTAFEELVELGIMECPECHNSTENDDWSYVDFTCKSQVACPQCGNVLFLDNIREDRKEESEEENG